MAVRRLPCKPRLPASEPDTMPRAFNPAFRYSRTIAALLLAILAAFAALPALANNIDTRLVVEGPVAPGGTVTLAIAQQPKPTWHGYWLNPGDAGFGMDTTWTLPEGWSVGRAEYPVPEPLVIGTLMNHVYEGPYAILVPLTVPADAKAGETMQINDLFATLEVERRANATAEVTLAAGAIVPYASTVTPGTADAFFTPGIAPAATFARFTLPAGTTTHCLNGDPTVEAPFARSATSCFHRTGR